MSTQFKKFIIMVASLVLGVATGYLLMLIYFRFLATPGNSFGWEGILSIPIAFFSTLFYYRSIKKAILK